MRLELIGYIPLQQGLRQIYERNQTTQTSHWVYSITTRIKTFKSFDKIFKTALIGYIPLQQGLRQ